MKQIDYTNASSELGKFMQLSSEGVKMTMPSEYIDKVWHNMLLDRDEYERFCITNCGQVIEHKESHGEGEVDPQFFFTESPELLNRAIASLDDGRNVHQGLLRPRELKDLKLLHNSNYYFHVLAQLLDVLPQETRKYAEDQLSTHTQNLS